MAVGANDKELISQYLKGDEKSLEILIKQYLKPIYSFVYRFVGNGSDAEDITQEVFVRMWRNIKKFDQSRSFKTWIFSIAKNASIDFLRKKKILPFSAFENERGDNVIIDTLVDKSPLPNAIFERLDITSLLNSAIEKLSLKYSTVIFLYYNNHLTFREIAEALNESLNTIKSRHRRAIIILKKLLGESF